MVYSNHPLARCLLAVRLEKRAKVSTRPKPHRDRTSGAHFAGAEKRDDGRWKPARRDTGYGPTVRQKTLPARCPDAIPPRWSQPNT